MVLDTYDISMVSLPRAYYLPHMSILSPLLARHLGTRATLDP